MNAGRATLRRAALAVLLMTGASSAAEAVPPGETAFESYGVLHEVLAGGRTEGRAALGDFEGREHFYAVGALAGLEGEVTFVDGRAIVSQAGPDGRLHAGDTEGLQATTLFGASVPSWREVVLDSDTAPTDIDTRLAHVLADEGTPTVFTVAGTLTDAVLHVIGGSCPVHARRNGIELPAEDRPFEATFERIDGLVVGVHATNAAGHITHPGTHVHAHLVFDDPETGETRTAHLESFGIAKGSTLRVPSTGAGRR